MTDIPYLGIFFSHGTPVWPCPVMKNPYCGIFPRHEAISEPSGRVDAADCCRGGAHRGEDKSTGPGVPTYTPDPARSAG